MTVFYTMFYTSLKVPCSLNYEDITGKYIQHTERKQRSDLIRSVSRLLKIKCWSGNCSVHIDGISSDPNRMSGSKQYGLDKLFCFNDKNNSNKNIKL